MTWTTLSTSSNHPFCAPCRQYLVVASKKVRPGSVYMLQVTLMALYHKDVYVRAMLSREGEEYSSKIIHFIEPGTKPMELDVSSSNFFFFFFFS